jgi:hypothetical protein
MGKHAKKEPRCVDCEIDAALKAFVVEVNAWLKDGGDARLVEFTPLDALHKVTRLCAKRERELAA